MKKRMLRESDLDLKKALEICRAAESTTTTTTSMIEVTLTTVAGSTVNHFSVTSAKDMGTSSEFVLQVMDKCKDEEVEEEAIRVAIKAEVLVKDGMWRMSLPSE